MRSDFAGVRRIESVSPSKLCLTVSALALALAAPTAALAQDTTPAPQDDEATQVDEIVVTGLRRGLADSISIKRNETSIVEAVSAEDIGKLPDVSIAESIARLPGLAAQRVNGRAQVISIRGLAPDFTTTLLNGRQAGEAGDRCGEGVVGKLADILGRDRLDDRGLVALDADRIGQTAPQAGDHDLLDLGRVRFLGGRRILRPGDAGRDEGQRERRHGKAKL